MHLRQCWWGICRSRRVAWWQKTSSWVASVCSTWSVNQWWTALKNKNCFFFLSLFIAPLTVQCNSTIMVSAVLPLTCRSHLPIVCNPIIRLICHCVLFKADIFSFYFISLTVLYSSCAWEWSATTVAPLSHRKHSSSPVAPPLILWLCDITLHHHVTLLHVLCTIYAEQPVWH